MNEDQLKVEAVEWLSSLRESAEHAKDFVLDQAPDVLRELVVLGRFESTLWLTIGLAAMVISGRWSPRFLKIDFDQGPDKGDNPKNLARAIAGVVMGFVALAMITCNYHGFITSWFAPRVYIIEHLTRLMSGK